MSNVTIQNNLLVATSGLHNYQETTNYITQAKIYYNTIWNNSASQTFHWAPQPVAPTANQLKNNFFWSKNEFSCYIESQQNAWTFASNVWIGVSTVPQNCTDTVPTSSSAVLDYAQVGFVGNYGAPSAWDTAFILLASSPAVGKATPLASVTHDYFGSPRSATAPSAGFAELDTSTSSSRGNGITKPSTTTTTGGGPSSSSSTSSSGAASIREYQRQVLMAMKRLLR